MAILSALRGGTAGAPEADWCRMMYAAVGGDHVVSGLQLSSFEGRTVKLEKGQGFTGGVEFTLTDPAFFTSPTNLTSNRRIDRLVARKTWPSMAVEIVVKPGTPAQTPLLEPLVQNHNGLWEFGLGYWVVPPNPGAIANGKVWGHYADDGSRLSGDLGERGAGALIATGRNDLILAMDYPALSVNQFAVPGSAKLRLDVFVSCFAQDTCAGTLTLQMAGEKATTTWKAKEVGPVFVPVSLDAKVSSFGGHQPAIVQMSVEGALDAATPLRVMRINAHQYQVMR